MAPLERVGMEHGDEGVAAMAAGPLEAPGGEFRVDGAFSLRRTDARPVGDLERATFVFETGLAECRYTTLGKPDYQVTWGTYGYRRGLVVSVEVAEPAVALYVQLRGAGERVVVAEGRVLELRPGEAAMAVALAGQGTYETRRESQGASFDVLFSRSYFLGLAERHAHLLGPFADALVAGRPACIGGDAAQITPRMWGVVQRIQRHDGADAAGSLFLEAGLLELIAHQVATPPRAGAANGVKLTRGDVERLHAARDLLLERLDDPPTLAELARYALTNEFKLKRGFKAIFGTSPYAYLLAHRLEQARTYLLETDWPVAEVARRVGYRDPAHLTNAFRKRFGVRPSDLR
ncbi:MAG TPA: AraC family transcriptional regulator [Longimicrobiales bacterium]